MKTILTCLIAVLLSANVYSQTKTVAGTAKPAKLPPVAATFEEDGAVLVLSKTIDKYSMTADQVKKIKRVVLRDGTADLAISKIEVTASASKSTRIGMVNGSTLNEQLLNLLTKLTTGDKLFLDVHVGNSTTAKPFTKAFRIL